MAVAALETAYDRDAYRPSTARLVLDGAKREIWGLCFSVSDDDVEDGEELSRDLKTEESQGR